MKLNFPFQLCLANCPLAKENRHSGVGVSVAVRENIMRVLGMKHRAAVFCLRENGNILNVIFVSLLWFRAFFPFVQCSLYFCILV